MAVSHQWFIQWSAPSMLFADITSKYNNVNKFDNYRESESEVIRDVERHYLRTEHNEDLFKVNNKGGRGRGRITQNINNNAKSSAIGLTLWLAMLGVSRPQSLPADNDTPPFSTLYKWKTIDFEFPSREHRNYAIATGYVNGSPKLKTYVANFAATTASIKENGLVMGEFIPENVLPLGIEVWGSRVWVTFPSWRRGVPATLATLTRAGGIASPTLKPYPNWNFHRAFNVNNNSCSGLTSVFRVSADPCGRLWVLDSGQIDLQDNPLQVCPPAIVVFDLLTDTIIARYKIPQKYALQDSLFSNIIVDTKDVSCKDLHVYIADTWRFGLIVFRQRDQEFWRFSNPLFYPDPLASNYTLHNVNFQWADGIFGLALSPLVRRNDKILYFHSLSSYNEFYVLTSVLQDRTKVNNSAADFHILGHRGLTGQSSASAMDRRGVMYYGLVMRDSVGCWNSDTSYGQQSQGVVAKNTETLVFPNDIKVDQEPSQSIWVITNKLPLYQAGVLEEDDYNYRILYASTEEAVRGTVCDPEVIPLTNKINGRWMP